MFLYFFFLFRYSTVYFCVTPSTVSLTLSALASLLRRGKREAERWRLPDGE